MDNPLRPPDTDLVFFGEPGRDGVRRPCLFDKAWTDAKKEAGLSDQEVATISGHKSMQMLKRYTHLRAENLVGKLDKLDC